MPNSWVDEKFFSNGINVATPRRLNPEFGCALLLYVVIFVQLIISFVIFGSKNSEVAVFGGDEELLCPGDYVSSMACGEYDGMHYAGDLGTCISEKLCEELRACVHSGRRRLDGQNINSFNFRNQLTSGKLLQRLATEDWPAPPNLQLQRSAARRLLQGEAHVPASVWGFLEEHVYQPIVLFLCATVLSAVWLFFLQKFAWAAIWGTIVADMAALLIVFFWCMVDLHVINWPCAVGVLLIAGIAFATRRQINNTAVITTQAMTGLRANARIFAVSAGVQLIWVLYFAQLIASVIGMHFVLEVGVDDSGDFDPWADNQSSCYLRSHSTLANDWMAVYFVVCYCWVTYFSRNVNLMLVTANVSGWYFQQEGSQDFWRKALRWSVCEQAGGNAMASAIMGASEYLMKRISSGWNLFFALLLPWNWILIAIAFALKTVFMTFTKFGLIAMTFSGKSFCESAAKGFGLLSAKLGQAVLTDYLGSRLMAWASYIIALCTGFAAWAWADDVQGVSTLSEVPLWGLIPLIILYSYILSHPFATLVCVVLIENHSSWFTSADDTDFRARMNSVLSSLFLGSITMCILNAISRLVVNAMDVIFFCFAVESDNRAQQERFTQLYSSIKSTIIEGSVQGQHVVQGNVVGPQPERPVAQATAVGGESRTMVIVGKPVPSNAAP